MRPTLTTAIFLLRNWTPMPIRDSSFLDDVLTEQGVAEMRDQCMSYWSAQKEGYDPDGSWLKNMLLDDAHHHAPLSAITISRVRW